MKSNTSKWKPSPADICKEYYETQIFSTGSVDNEATATYFFADASITLGAIDNNLKDVDMTLYFKEVVALNMELFGLAWLNFNDNYKITEQYSSSPEIIWLGEITTAKQYLLERGHTDIWNNMHSYNEVIAKSLSQKILYDRWDSLRDIPKFVKSEDSFEANKNDLVRKLKMLLDVFNKYTKDSEIINLISTRQVYVPYGIFKFAVLSRFLALEFASRIGCKPNQDGIFALQEFIAALHQNATSYLESVYEWGSYTSAKKATYDTVLMLKKFLDRQNK